MCGGSLPTCLPGSASISLRGDSVCQIASQTLLFRGRSSLFLTHPVSGVINFPGVQYLQSISLFFIGVFDIPCLIRAFTPSKLRGFPAEMCLYAEKKILIGSWREIQRDTMQMLPMQILISGPCCCEVSKEFYSATAIIKDKLGYFKNFLCPEVCSVTQQWPTPKQISLSLFCPYIQLSASRNIS